MKVLKFILLALFICLSYTATSQPDWNRVNYCSSTIFCASIVSETCILDTNDVIGVFVDGECRMKTHLIQVGDSLYASAVIHSSGTIEYANAKFWDSESNTIYDFDTVLTVSNHGAIMNKSLILKRSESVNIQKIPNEQISKIELYNILGVYIGSYASVNDIKTIVGTYIISITYKDGKILKRKIIL